MRRILSERDPLDVFRGSDAPRAPAVTRQDWTEPSGFEAEDLAEEQRAFLAARWAELALGDHAEVARFAGLLVHFLALGAPWDLVVRAEQAIFSTTRFAGLRFDVARGFSGREVGPGPLPQEACDWGADPCEVARRVFFEGCVNKTLAATEATWAAARTSYPELAVVLEEIARGERVHADLFFRFLAWELGRSPELIEDVGDWVAGMAGDEVERVSRVELRASDTWIEEFGLVPADVREALRVEAGANVISCLDGLLRGLGRHEALWTLGRESGFDRFDRDLFLC